MKEKVVIEATRTGYSAYSNKFPVFTTGSTLEELKINIIEAFNLYFKDVGKVITEDSLELYFDIASVFDLHPYINVKAFSERLGMSQSLLAQYVRRIKKPSLRQSRKIFKGINQIGKELASIQMHEG